MSIPSKSGAAPQIAFDPLNASPFGTPVGTRSGKPALSGRVASRAKAPRTKVVDLDESDLPLEMRLSLEDSLELLALEDTAAPKFEAEPAEHETFVLGSSDELDLDDAGFIAAPLKGKGAPQLFSFNLRNVVVPCGLVVGCFVLLWTRDLVSPALGSASAETDVKTTTLALAPALNTTKAGMPGPLTSAPQVAPSVPTMVTNSELAVNNTPLQSVQPQTSGNGLPSTAVVEQDQSQSSSSVVSSVPSTLSSQPQQSAPRTNTLQVVNFPDRDAALASSNGVPLNPTASPRAEIIVVRPTEEPATSKENGQAFLLPAPPTTEKASPGAKEPGQQRPAFRPRGTEGNRPRALGGPERGPRVGGRKMRDKNGQVPPPPTGQAGKTNGLKP